MKINNQSISIVIAVAVVSVAIILIVPMLFPAAASKSLASRMTLDPSDLKLNNYLEDGDPSSNSTFVQFTYDYLSVRLWLEVWNSTSTAHAHFNVFSGGNISDGNEDSYRYGNLTIGEDSRIIAIMLKDQYGLSISFVRGNVTVFMTCEFRLYQGTKWDYSVERALILAITQDLKIMKILGKEPVFLP